ncbi:DUF6281 family protein [Streptomyces sp. NPDC054829]|nr:DUF6281 family protein [Streptomyces sp. SBE_14.2]
MRRALLMAGITAVALGGVGCAESDGGGTGGAVRAEASCAHVVAYEGRDYVSVADIDYRRGEKLGTATNLACDDTPDDGDFGDPAREVTAYAVEGVDPAVAIAVEDAGEVTLMAELAAGGKLPPELEELRSGQD